jgi:hypothetical protein
VESERYMQPIRLAFGTSYRSIAHRTLTLTLNPSPALAPAVDEILVASKVLVSSNAESPSTSDARSSDQIESIPEHPISSVKVELTPKIQNRPVNTAKKAHSDHCRESSQATIQSLLLRPFQRIHHGRLAIFACRGSRSAVMKPGSSAA